MFARSWCQVEGERRNSRYKSIRRLVTIELDRNADANPPLAITIGFGARQGAELFALVPRQRFPNELHLEQIP